MRVATPVPPRRDPPPPATVGQALAQGWRLWALAPLPILLATWLPLAGAMLAGVVPGIGGLLSTLASGALGVLPWLTLDAAARGHAVTPALVLQQARARPRVPVALALVSLLLGTVLAVAMSRETGVGVATIVLAGLPADLQPTRGLFMAILAVAPVAWLLQWMAPRMLFADRSATEAFGDCVSAVASAPWLLFGYLAASAGLLLVGVATVVGVGPVLPWLAASGYALQRTLFADRSFGIAL